MAEADGAAGWCVNIASTTSTMAWYLQPEWAAEIYGDPATVTGGAFAPNGRVVMFFRDPGGNSGPSLFTVDISGRNELRVPTPGFASDPAWSPLLS